METYWTAAEIVLEPIAPAPETNVSAQTLVNALEQEVSEWNRVLEACRGAPHLTVGPLRAHGAARDDGHSVVALVNSSWCPADRRGIEGCYDEKAQAITHVRTRDDLSGPRGGEIRETDIEINAVNFGWSKEGQSPQTRSLRAILGHELGHAFGLDHSCSPTAGLREDAGALACSAGTRRSIMYPDPTEPGRPKVLTPGPDAISTLCSTTYQQVRQ
jgi:hypothetical protein